MGDLVHHELESNSCASLLTTVGGGWWYGSLPETRGGEPPSRALVFTDVPAIQICEGIMCFSAAGSFAISGVLSTLGALSLARASSTPHRMLAGVPLIFAAQQAAEGTVWLTIDGSHALLNRAAVSLFLGVAFIVWPIWLPLALAIVERSSTRKRVLQAAFSTGCLIALCAAVLIARLHPVPRVVGHSIGYQFSGSDHAPTLLLYLVAYVVPSVVPFFVSTFSRARWMGSMLVVSLAVSAIVQRGALTSVWCFFAAVLSGFMLFAVDRDQRALSALRSPAV